MKIKKRVRISEFYYTKDDIKFLYENNLINVADYRDIDKIVIENGKCFINGNYVSFMENERIVNAVSTYFIARNRNSLIVCSISTINDGIYNRNVVTYPISVLNMNHKLKCLL